MSVTYEMKCSTCGGTGLRPGGGKGYCACTCGTVRVTREECIEKLLNDPAMNEPVTVREEDPTSRAVREVIAQQRDEARAEAERERENHARVNNALNARVKELNEARAEAERLRGIMQGYVWGMEAAVREGEVKQTVADGLLHATRAALEAGKA